MRHYSLEDWADLARNVAGDAKKLAMHTHLESGCEPCSKVYILWQHIHRAGQREGAYHPPESVVRAMKGLGAIHGIRKAPKAGSAIVQLLFDSFRVPLQAGVRSAQARARQLLYAAGAYRIDLRMEVQTDSEKVAVVGQVLNAADPADKMRSVPVMLFRGSKKVSASETNSLGEFHLECDLVDDLKLHFKLPSELNVWISLVNPTEGTGQDPTDSSGVKSLSKKLPASSKGKTR